MVPWVQPEHKLFHQMRLFAVASLENDQPVVCNIGLITCVSMLSGVWVLGYGLEYAQYCISVYV